MENLIVFGLCIAWVIFVHKNPCPKNYPTLSKEKWMLALITIASMLALGFALGLVAAILDAALGLL